jgi:hypothetical protein
VDDVGSYDRNFMIQTVIEWPPLVVRDPGYRSEIWVRFPEQSDFLRSSGSGTESTQPRKYN